MYLEKRLLKQGWTKLATDIDTLWSYNQNNGAKEIFFKITIKYFIIIMIIIQIFIYQYRENSYQNFL